jgi:hypothetical protein
MAVAEPFADPVGLPEEGFEESTRVGGAAFGPPSLIRQMTIVAEMTIRTAMTNRTRRRRACRRASLMRSSDTSGIASSAAS